MFSCFLSINWKTWSPNYTSCLKAFYIHGFLNIGFFFTAIYLERSVSNLTYFLSIFFLLCKLYLSDFQIRDPTTIQLRIINSFNNGVFLIVLDLGKPVSALSYFFTCTFWCYFVQFLYGNCSSSIPVPWILFNH